MAKVTFQESGVTAEWTGNEESLLEFGEAQGLDLPFGCRAGNCTSCQQEIVEGEVEYLFEPGADPDPGHRLLCCSEPKGDIVIKA